MKNELLHLEDLKFSEAVDRLAAIFDEERRAIIQSMQERGIRGSGICGEQVEQAALRMLRGKIDKRIELRKASIESASEGAGSDDLRGLEKSTHEMIDPNCRSLPHTISKACGISSVIAETAAERRRWEDQVMALKREASRKIRMIELDTKIKGRNQPEYALIAALPVEFAAIQSMMDSVFEITKDGIAYKIGSIGPHAVIAALLTHMGNNFAAIGAAKLLNSFPTVRDILMVGIAAGVPEPGNVRLGDIIVSDKGVVQYDNVKRIGDKVEVRDSSAKPSAHLIRAIGAIQTLSYSNERPWEAHLDRARSLQFKRPVPGSSRVHYGRIGSGNMLLRDAALRDELARNHKLLGFEMEGSGIADATWDVGRGYLLVRGVSDHADIQKDDTWQPYAALAAAAYARSVIEHVASADNGQQPVHATSETQLTAVVTNPLESLVNRRVKVGPVVPVAHGNAVYLVNKVDADFVELAKEGTWHNSIVVPVGYVMVIPERGDDQPMLQLAGRLQWVTATKKWKFFAEKPLPQDEFGFGRSASDNDYLVQLLHRESKQPRWARRDRISDHLENGYQVAYDDQGLYLRRGDQILLSKP